MAAIIPSAAEPSPGIDRPGDDRTRPTPDSANIRYVLMPVRAPVADRLSDDSAVDFVLPQQLAGVCVDRFEPAVHGSIEDQVAAGRDSP